MNSKFTLPLSIPKGTLSSIVSSEGMSLDEVSLGLIDFKLSVSGTYKDASGNDVALSGKSGTLTLRAAPSICTDNTIVDPDSTDIDVSTYCSVPNKGKYCRVGSKGEPTLTDRASICGCPTGQMAVGEVCKATNCVPNSCIAGTADYCLSDGQSIERRCQQCGVANCPVDAYGSSATSCSPATSGVFSQCIYQSISGGGFLVNFAPVNINTIAECGDGIKSDSEQCDTNDFGGESCSTVGFTGGTLSCSASCTYITTNCVAGFVKFRTFNLTYVSGNAIGYTSVCGNTLTKYGRTNGACTDKFCDAAADLMIPTSTGTTKLFVRGSEVCICDPGVTSHTYAKRYSQSDPNAYKVNDIKTSIDSSKEVSCT